MAAQPILSENRFQFINCVFSGNTASEYGGVIGGDSVDNEDRI